MAPLKITYLSMDGCPNAPVMLEAFQKAVRTLEIKFEIEYLDIYELAERNDLRAGYGSPTILVDGGDMFGAPVPQSSDPGCRVYGKALPEKDEIVSRLREFHQAARGSIPLNSAEAFHEDGRSSSNDQLSR